MFIIAAILAISALTVSTVTAASRPAYSDRPDPDDIIVVSKEYIPLAKVSPNEANLIRATVVEMQDRSRYADMVRYFDELEAKYGSLIFDNYLPSMYNYRGVALHQIQNFQGAEQAFLDGVTAFPGDSRTWINLGETRVHQFRLDLAVEAFGRAMALEEATAPSRMLKAKGWIASYQDWEFLVSLVEKNSLAAAEGKSFANDGGSGLEYTNAPGWIFRELSRHTPNVADTPYVVENIASLWDVKEEIAREAAARRALAMQKASLSASFGGRGVAKVGVSASKGGALARPYEPAVPRRRLKVGVISSDFGVHPVSSLIRGVLEMINQDEIELFLFAVTNKMSWWGMNITASTEHFIKLFGKNLEEAAVEIAQTGVEILIDLNGHTLNTGLSIMKFRPAPVQMSFLGLPTTTAGSFVDYYIGDPVALPPEISDHFSEKLLLMPPCYIANDYAQLLSGVLQLKNEKRWSRDTLRADQDLNSVSILFGTFSNTQKLDPSIMQVWMNILSRFVDSKFFIVEHMGAKAAKPHLRNISISRGIHPERMAFAKHLPWIHHIQAKTAVDILLDSTSKNAHTTGLDGAWAGVPTITLAGGRNMPARAGESIAAGLESETGLAYSLKEYEDLAIHFASNHRKLRVWRDKVERLRTTSTLFDTKRWTAYFSRLLMSTWESIHVAQQIGPWRDDDSLMAVPYNVFHVPEFGRPHELDVFHVVEPDLEELVYLSERQKALEANRGAGRNPSNKNKVYHAVPDSPKDVPKRGGVGTGRNDPLDPDSDVASEQFGDKTPDSYYDGTAHRVYMCTSEEKKRAAVIEGALSSMCPAPSPSSSSSSSSAIPPHLKKHMAAAEAVVAQKRQYASPIPPHLFRRSPLVLNIGGLASQHDWVVINGQSKMYNLDTYVDVLRPMENLQGFPNASVDAIYNSHILEHAPKGKGEFLEVLREWRRVLKPGGKLVVSVPDLQTLAMMYSSQNLPPVSKWHITNMIFGAQSDEFDYHKNGFDAEILAIFLYQEGFCGVTRVGLFNLLNDTSATIFMDHFISLNVIATKCYNETEDGTPPIGSMERVVTINDHLLKDEIVSEMGLSEEEIENLRNNYVLDVRIPPLKELIVPFSNYKMRASEMEGYTSIDRSELNEQK